MVWPFSPRKQNQTNNVVPQASGSTHGVQRTPRNNKERLAHAEVETQHLRYELAKVQDALEKTRTQEELVHGRPAELQQELNAVQQDLVERRDKRAKLQEVIEKAKSDRIAATEELKVSEHAGAVQREESLVLREKIRRLSEKRAAFRLAENEAKAKRDERIAEDQSNEATELMGKMSEALEAKLTSTIAEAAAVDLEKEMWRRERHKLLQSLSALKDEHDAARAKLLDVRRAAMEAEAQNDELRRQFPAAKEKLQEVRNKYVSLEGVIDNAERETHDCDTYVKAMSSEYQLEADVVKSVLKLTKGRKKEADDTHAARVVEITNVVEERQRRRSKDATMDDVLPEAVERSLDRSINAPSLPQAMLAPTVEFSPRDVMPGLKMKEFSRTSPHSTGIPDPKLLVRSGKRMVETLAIKSREACAHCGNVMMGDAQFCRVCGERRDTSKRLDASTLPVLSQESCLTCGNVYIGDAAFCRKCGTKRLAGPSQ